MENWYCQNCGITTLSILKPHNTHNGKCSRQFDIIRWELSSGKKDWKPPKNIQIHSWVKVDDYINQHGSLTTLHDLHEQLNERDETRNRINNRYQELHGRDLIDDEGGFTYDPTSDDDLNQSPKKKGLFNEIVSSLKDLFK